MGNLSVRTFTHFMANLLQDTKQGLTWMTMSKLWFDQNQFHLGIKLFLKIKYCSQMH